MDSEPLNTSKSPKPMTSSTQMLNDQANRIIVFPQNYVDYAREQQEKAEAAQALVDAKEAKQKRKEEKKRKKYKMVHNKRKKMLKHLHPAPKKRRLPLWDAPENIRDGHQVVNKKLWTPGGPGASGNGGNAYRPDIPKDSDDSDSSSSGIHEETEETFLQNFVNLQVAMMDGNYGNKQKQPGSKRKGKGKEDDIDIFEGVKDKSAKFEYVPPDAFQYKKQVEKPDTDSYSNSYSNSHDGTHSNHSTHFQPKKVSNKLDGIDYDKLRSSGPWNCEFCGFHNKSRDEICQKCYAESFKRRYEAFMNVVDGNNQENIKQKASILKKRKSKAPVNAQNDNRPKWQCSLCTFINTINDSEDEDDDICTMCGRTDPHREREIDRKLGIAEEEKEAMCGPTEEQKENRLKAAISEKYFLREDKNRKMKKFKPKKKMDGNHKKGADKMASKMVKSAKYSESGQIANIHREWHAEMWKQHKLQDPSRKMVAKPQKLKSQVQRQQMNGNRNGNGRSTGKPMKSNHSNGFKPHSAAFCKSNGAKAPSPSISKSQSKKKQWKSIDLAELQNESKKSRKPPPPKSPPQGSKVVINRRQIGARSQKPRNMQNREKQKNPWDGNTDHVKRDFAGAFVPHAKPKGKSNGKTEEKQNGKKGQQKGKTKAHQNGKMKVQQNGKVKTPQNHQNRKSKGQQQNGKRKGNIQSNKPSKNGNQIPNGQSKGNDNQNASKNKKSKRQIRREQHKQNNKSKSDEKSSAFSIRSNDVAESSEESEADEAEDRFEWMQKMVNMGFEADKAFEAIAQSENFNEALERLMQSIV